MVPVPVTLYQDESWPLVKVKSLQTQLQRAAAAPGVAEIRRLSCDPAHRGHGGHRCKHRPLHREKGSARKPILRSIWRQPGEIARQVRLRNLSGIIIIDFIDMEDAGMRRQLFEYLKELVQGGSGKDRPCGHHPAEPGGNDPERRNASPSMKYWQSHAPRCHGLGFVYDLSDVGGSDE